MAQSMDILSPASLAHGMVNILAKYGYMALLFAMIGLIVRILWIEWKGWRESHIIDEERLDMVEIAHPYIPKVSHIIAAIILARTLQRTPAATEAMYLLAHHVFDALGYRRYEWKCDSCNEPSRSAAARLGFTYEGRFRNAMVYKGRNRDTDWFSVTDAEWPGVRAAHEAWLDPANFDEEGVQRSRLRVAP